MLIFADIYPRENGDLDDLVGEEEEDSDEDEDEVCSLHISSFLPNTGLNPLFSQDSGVKYVLNVNTYTNGGFSRRRFSKGNPRTASTQI